MVRSAVPSCFLPSNCHYKWVTENTSPVISVSLLPEQNGTVPNTNQDHVLITALDCLGNLRFSVAEAGDKGGGMKMCLHK